ncbi:MAG: hypothetical protein CVU61_03010 [Deltaproteobacteria bacterium HGW-Deltaproteobacteria-19]|jgi:hypothetical protein|nr:MAG: hypothetical protein CVU61_03010 [Deltaproteobacteria bacterium HGW-Deltaproteobacteria-19]
MNGTGAACSVCGQAKFFVSCIDCRVPLCEGCARFELLAEGCGTVVPAYFCPDCAVNPLVNPNAAFRDDF